MSALMRSPPVEALSLAALAASLFEDPATGTLVLDEDGWVVRANQTVARMTGLELAGIEGWPAVMLFAASDRARFKAMLADARGGILTPAFLSRLEATGLAVGLELAPLPAGSAPSGGHVLRLRECRSTGAGKPDQHQRLHAIGQLATGIAHDLNNVIGAMLAATGAIEESANGLVQREALAELRGGANRARGLIERLLGFGRPLDRPASLIPIDEAIVDLTEMLRRLFPARIALVLDLQASQRQVLADPTRIDQVLLNLAINARDAIPEAGTLTIRSRFRDLVRGFDATTGQVPPGEHVVIELRDSGTGMAPEMVPRIFDPYFTTKAGQGGTGLGLATVREIVAELDGVLDVKSELGRGTRMRVYLPCAKAEAKSAPLAARASMGTGIRAPGSEPGRRGTVLLVEDDHSLRRLAEAALRRQGWGVVWADCATDALAATDRLRAGASRPSLMVSDVTLPDMNGWALATAIRERLAAPELPIIMTSGGWEKPPAKELARLAGGAKFLAKPYEIADLLALADQFAHGPGPIVIAGGHVKNPGSNIKSPIDEHMTNSRREGAPCSVAPEDSNVTDSAELA